MSATTRTITTRVSMSISFGAPRPLSEMLPSIESTRCWSRRPGLGAAAATLEQSEYLQDDDDHHDRADDVQDRVHQGLLPQPRQRRSGPALGRRAIARRCTTAGCWEAAGTSPAG